MDTRKIVNEVICVKYRKIYLSRLRRRIEGGQEIAII